MSFSKTLQLTMEFKNLPISLLLCICITLRHITASFEMQLQFRSNLKSNMGLIPFVQPKIEVFKRTKPDYVWNAIHWESINNSDGIKDLLAENIDGLKLSCKANYPVQWTLEGLTGFRFSSGSPKKSEDGLEYNEDFTIDHLAEPYTGKYTCGSKYFNSELSSSVFIFVPGNELFVNTRGKNIYFAGNDLEEIRIPCGVSHPNVTVSLLKSNSDSNEFTNVTSRAAFDPKLGYNFKSHDQKTEGRYFCVARSRGIIKVVEYNLIMESKSVVHAKCNRACEENSHCTLDDHGYEYCKCDTGFNTFDTDPFYFTCLKECQTNDNCPTNMSCESRINSNNNPPDPLIGNDTVIQDYAAVCKNPCIYYSGNHSSQGYTYCKAQSHNVKVLFAKSND